MTKVILALVGCTLLTMLAPSAMADVITFTYAITTGSVATIADESGSPALTGGPAGDVVVKDTATASAFALPDATAMIDSDNNTSYSAGPTMLVASYAGSGAIQVEVLSSSLCGGICLSGTNSFGTYTAGMGGAGAFGGVFDVTFVSPNILALFGDTGMAINPNGGAAFTTGLNTWTSGGTTSSAQFGSGSITFQTSTVPEPGMLRLVLLSTGVFGLAKVIRRKKI